jgi:hypothetical protein
LDCGEWSLKPKENDTSRAKEFFRKVKGTHFYLIPLLLTVVYAILAYTSQEIISNNLKLGIAVTIGIVTVGAIYLWIVLFEVPDKVSQLEFKEKELTTRESEFKKRQDDLEGHVQKLEETLEHLNYPVRYRQFRREIVLTENLGESEQIWDLTVENISNENIYEIIIPVKTFDLYDAFRNKIEELKKLNPDDAENVIRTKAFQDIEQVFEVIIGEKSLDQTMIPGLLYDLTIQNRRFALRGSYVDALTSEGEVAEIVYRIPLEGENYLQPGKPKRIVFKVRNKCAFKKVLDGESTSLRVERLYDEATITIRCPEGYEIARNPIVGANTGLVVKDTSTKTIDKKELARVSNVHIDPDCKRLVWTITKPRISYVYIIFFKITKVS